MILYIRVGPRMTALDELKKKKKGKELFVGNEYKNKHRRWRVGNRLLLTERSNSSSE